MIYCQEEGLKTTGALSLVNTVIRKLFYVFSSLVKYCLGKTGCGKILELLPQSHCMQELCHWILDKEHIFLACLRFVLEPSKDLQEPLSPQAISGS